MKRSAPPSAGGSEKRRPGMGSRQGSNRSGLSYGGLSGGGDQHQLPQVPEALVLQQSNHPFLGGGGSVQSRDGVSSSHSLGGDAASVGTTQSYRDAVSKENLPWASDLGSGREVEDTTDYLASSKTAVSLPTRLRENCHEKSLLESVGLHEPEKCLPKVKSFVEKLVATPRNSMIMQLGVTKREGDKENLRTLTEQWESDAQQHGSRVKACQTKMEELQPRVDAASEALARATKTHKHVSDKMSGLLAAQTESTEQMLLFNRQAILASFILAVMESLDKEKSTDWGADVDPATVQSVLGLEGTADYATLEHRTECLGTLHIMDTLGYGESDYVRGRWAEPGADKEWRDLMGVTPGIKTSKGGLKLAGLRERVANLLGHEKPPYISLEIDFQRDGALGVGAGFDGLSDEQLQRVNDATAEALRQRRASADGSVPPPAAAVASSAPAAAVASSAPAAAVASSAPAAAVASSTPAAAVASSTPAAAVASSAPATAPAAAVASSAPAAAVASSAPATAVASSADAGLGHLSLEQLWAELARRQGSGAGGSAGI